MHDEAEIEACLEVLRSGPTAFRIGKRVKAFEEEVAALFGKRFGVAVNSGSSALELAVALLALPPGSEVLTSVLTFSTDIAPLVRAGLVPVFADVEPDTYNVDVDALERLVGPATRAVLMPEPGRQRPRLGPHPGLADAHALTVVEDSCDALGATLRGTPTGTRSDISVTSFAASHIITAAGNGGMVLLDDEATRDRALLLRRWGRSSEVQFYGSRKGDTRFLAEVDGMEYDSLFVFEELGWNFEPSELGAAFGLVQLGKLAANHEVRQRNFARYTAFFGRYPDRFEVAPPARRPRHRVARVPVRPPARGRHQPSHVPGGPRGPWGRDPDGLDGERHPPADAARRQVPLRSRRLPERRPRSWSTPCCSPATTSWTTTTSTSSPASSMTSSPVADHPVRRGAPMANPFSYEATA